MASFFDSEFLWKNCMVGDIIEFHYLDDQETRKGTVNEMIYDHQDTMILTIDSETHYLHEWAEIAEFSNIFQRVSG